MGDNGHIRRLNEEFLESDVEKVVVSIMVELDEAVCVKNAVAVAAFVESAHGLN